MAEPAQAEKKPDLGEQGRQFAEKLVKAQALLKGLYGRDYSKAELIINPKLQGQLGALSALNTTIFKGASNPIDANNKDALRNLLEHQNQTAAFNEAIKDKPEAIAQIAAIFNSHDRTQIDAVATAIANNDQTNLQRLIPALSSAQPVAVAPPTAPAVAEKPLSPDERQSLYISAALDEISTADPKKYKANGPVALSDDGNRATITIEGQKFYYQKFKQADPNEPTGLRAAAWKQCDASGKELKSADGKLNLYFSYSGYGGTEAQTRSLEAIGRGELNPQTPGAVAFFNKTVEEVGKANISTVHIGSGSAGASNARASQLAALSQNITADLVLMDPVGDQLGYDRIKAAIENPKGTDEEKLRTALTANGTTKETLLAQLAESKKSTTAVRPYETNKTGEVTLSRAARLVPGGTAAQNAAIMFGMANGTDVVANNEAAGRTVYLNVTNVTNSSNAALAAVDPLHDSTRMRSGLGNSKAPIITSTDFQALPAQKLSEKQQQNMVRLAEIGSNHPKFNELLPQIAGNITQNRNTDPAARQKIQTFIDTTLNNPTRLGKFADLVENDENFRQQVTSTVQAKGTDGKPVSVEKTLAMLSTTMEMAEKNPELLSRAAAVKTKADALDGKLGALVKANEDLLKAHPELRLTPLSAIPKLQAQIAEQRKAQGDTDISKLNPATLKTNEELIDQVTGVVDALANHPLTAQALDGALDKYMVNGKLDPEKLKANPTMAGFLDKGKLQVFADQSELLLTKHPGVGKFLVGKIDPGKPLDPNSAGMFAQLYNDPQGIAKVTDLLDKNLDAEALMTRNLDPMTAMMDPSFMMRNPTLFEGARDPFVNKLIAQDNPEIAKILANPGAKKTITSLLQSLGFAPSNDNTNAPGGQPQGQQNGGNSIMNALASGDVGAIIAAVCALIFGGGSGFDMRSLMAGGQSQSTGTSRT